MFFSREKELQILKTQFQKTNNAVAIYGKRRVGKTALIKQADKGGKTFIYFECLHDLEKENVQLFKNECEKQGVSFPNYFVADRFIQVFEYLNTLNKSLVVAIDEYPYLRELNNPSAIDSEFQNIIDNRLTNINLVISGSQIRMMEEILAKGNPLFGRFSETIYLEELNYKEASNFYSHKSVYDKIAFYSVFAGSPFINECIDETKSLKENIIDTYLHVGGKVYNYAHNVLLSDVTNKMHAQRILSVLSNSKKKHKEIIDVLDKDRTGIINRSLNSLVELKIIKKVEPINKLGDSKKASYEIRDNVLRFFYSYIYKNQSQLELLGPQSFYEEYIETTIDTFISRRFEEQVRQYFSLQVKEGKIKGIKNIGTYYYDDIENKTNGEFDVVLATNDGYNVYEAKYYKEPISDSVINKEIDQIEKIKDISINKIGFVSATGFKNKKENFIYIDGDALYK